MGSTGIIVVLSLVTSSIFLAAATVTVRNANRAMHVLATERTSLHLRLRDAEDRLYRRDREYDRLAQAYHSLRSQLAEAPDAGTVLIHPKG